MKSALRSSVSLGSKKTTKWNSEDAQPLSARQLARRAGTMAMRAQEPGTLAEKVYNHLKQKTAKRSAAIGVGVSSQFIENELANVALLKQCSSAFLAFLAEDCTPSSYVAGDVIHEKGTFGSTLLFVLRGTVSASRDGAKLMRVTKGQHIGETMLFGLENVWRVMLEAETSCVVCEVERSTFQKALKRFPEENTLYAPVLAIPHSAMTAGLHNRTANIFEGLSHAALHALDHCTINRLFFPGEKMLQEELGDRFEVLILVEGTVVVEIAGRVVRTKACGSELEELLENQESSMIDADNDAQDNSPAFFGELECLGAKPARNITLKAQTVCLCRIINKESLRKVSADSLLQGDGDNLIMEMAEHDFQHFQNTASRGSVFQDFVQAGCSQDFIEFMERNLEVRLVTHGKLLWDSRSLQNSFHSIIRGNAYVTNPGVDFDASRNLEVDEVFGNMTSLNMGARPSAGPARVTAATDCLVETLHQGVVVRALELFPDQRVKILFLEAPSARRGGKSQQVQKSQDFTDFLEMSPFFSGMDPNFVQDLSLVAVDRIFMQGEAIMHEGDVGHSMFIMVSGSADVYVSDKAAAVIDKRKLSTKKKSTKHMSKVGRLAPGAVAGELAMLGIIQTRSATIQASSMCVLWEVTQEKAMEILDRFPQERALFGTVIVQNLDLTVPGRLLQLPLFKAFDRKFRMLVTLYCKRHAFFPDHTMVAEGEVGDKLWILNLGPASLLKGGFTVKLLGPGGHFGCDHMLGITRCYVAALKAVSVCHALSLCRSSYLMALEQYPSKAAHAELLSTQKTESNLLREAAERIAARKRIFQRYQGEVKQHSVFFLSDEELTAHVARGWHEYAAQRKASRNKRMKELIKLNLSERGPLRYMEDDDDELVDFPQALPLLPRQHKQLVSALKAWPTPRPSPHYNLKLWGMVGEELSESGRESTLLPMLSASPRGNVQEARSGPSGSATPRKTFGLKRRDVHP
eukprot:TRINITY_DN15955_c0_g1_i2.p1 TRINITY_DN15955_c0_g1~~TRINITY_DN15955_c0_g1_i2.p1  ORF type:complete len:975 (+),score=182.32 TRINITY_DN15955_c0_g1_i2:123-3047(+)